MDLDDATLFLSKNTHYTKTSDLHTLAPELFLDYKKECLQKDIPSMDFEDFYFFTVEWINKDIRTIN